MVEVVDRPRGRRRDAAVDEAILASTLEVLAERGLAGFTVSEVIHRSGVSSATLYRRWSNANELLVAAVSGLSPAPPMIDLGSLDDDLSAFVDYLCDELAARSELASGAAPTMGIDPPLRDVIFRMFVRPRQVALEAILERARHRGEIGTPPPLLDLWSLVAGPIHHCIYVRGATASDDFRRSLTTVLLAGLRAASVADETR